MTTDRVSRRQIAVNIEARISELEAEVAALRAALATRPEPLFEGELFEFTGDGRAAMIRRVDASSWPFVARKGLRNTRVVVYAANPAPAQEDT